MYVRLFRIIHFAPLQVPLFSRWKLCPSCSCQSPMVLPKISATSLNRRFSRFFTTLQYTNRLYLNLNICSEGNVPILSSTNKATVLVCTGFRFGSQRSYVPCPVEPCKTSSIGLLSRQTPSIAVPYDDVFRWLHVRHSSSSLIELNTDNNVVKFNVDNRPVNDKNQRKDKALRKKKMSKKAKLNELRFYRLKARKKMNSPNPEVRIRYKLDKAKRKEEWLIEKLRKFDVPKMPDETHDPEILTEEERFYLKRTGEKKKNYVPVGRRGVFGGVILNMHLHWKNHETVKVVCKPCKPGQVRIYAEELARLSKGIVIDIKPNNTIIFYRGKNYAQPEIMSPPDTLSNAKALEKYKFEQSLEHTSEFIEKLENELEEYYKHLAQYRKVNEDAL